MITSRPMQAAQCDACGAERIGPVLDAVPGLHVDVTEVRPGGDWRAASLFFCSRRCAGKHVAAGVDGEEWLCAEALVLPPNNYPDHSGPGQEASADDATPSPAEANDALRLAADG